MAKGRAKLHHDQFRALRESKETQAELLKRARRASGMLPPGHAVTVGIAENDRRGRARATIKTETTEARVYARRHPEAYLRAASAVADLTENGKSGKSTRRTQKRIKTLAEKRAARG